VNCCGGKNKPDHGNSEGKEILEQTGCQYRHWLQQ